MKIASCDCAVGAVAARLMSTATRLGCCACATSGQEAAAPPTTVRNSRRLMQFLIRSSREGVVLGEKSTIARLDLAVCNVLHPKRRSRCPRPTLLSRIYCSRSRPELALLRHQEAIPSCPLPGMKRACRKHRLRSESDLRCAAARLDRPHMSRPTGNCPKETVPPSAPRGERDRIGWPAPIV